MNATNIVNEVVRLTTEYPDTVYKYVDNMGCKYTLGSECIEDKTGCLIGVAIQKSYPKLTEALEELDSKPECLGVINVMNYLGIEYNDKQKYFLSSIQQLQDTGNTWGDALKIALENSDPHTIT